ncbi:GntR family transcriptional regulator [Actinopolymorpha pittospori]
MSALQPIEAVQLGDRTFDLLRQAIINGELAPGEPLRDRALGTLLGVSRTPVREALHRLEHAGLVESRGRSGWVVAAFTEQDVRELFQLRRALEPLGLEQLEQEPEADAVAEIGAFFEGYGETVPTERYAEYFAHDHAFHKRIVQCGRNVRLEQLYAVIESHIDRGRHFLSLGAVGRVDANLEEHRAVARAVAERDFARARRELLHHLEMGEQLMIDQIRKQQAAS